MKEVGHLGVHSNNIASFSMMADLLGKTTGGFWSSEVEDVQVVLEGLGVYLNAIGFSGTDVDVSMGCVPKVEKIATTEVVPVCNMFSHLGF